MIRSLPFRFTVVQITAEVAMRDGVRRYVDKVGHGAQKAITNRAEIRRKLAEAERDAIPAAKHYRHARRVTSLKSRHALGVANGRALEKHRNPHADILAVKGMDHERHQLNRFEREGRTIVRIADPDSALGWAESADQTRRAM